MNKVIFAAALTLVLALAYSGTAAAQTQQFGTEVCVNASNADEAKRLFPNAALHVIPDSPDHEKNGWRIVSGEVGPNGRIHTDAREIELRKREGSYHGW